jgi:hypothetical protein
VLSPDPRIVDLRNRICKIYSTNIDVGLAIEFEFEVDGARPPLAIAYAWLLRVEAGVCGVCCAVDLLNNSGWLTVLFASKTEQYEQKTDQYGPHGLGNLLQLLFPRRK